MLVLPVPRPPLHRLCVDKRRDVVGADSGRAVLPRLLWLWHLLDSFGQDVPLRGGGGGVGVSSSVSIIPLADLSRRGQPLQRHADGTRHVPGALGAELDLWCRAGSRRVGGAGAAEHQG